MALDSFVKLLVLGDTNVGKTSLLKRFFDDQAPLTTMITLGVDFREKMCLRGEKNVRVQVWDTAGQERFRTITPTMYRGCHGIIIGYDITDKESFANVKYWSEQLQQHANENVQKFLIGNKLDLADKASEAGNMRAVQSEEGSKLASSLGMAFSEASACTGQNVEAAFFEIVDSVLANRGSIDQGSELSSYRLSAGPEPERPACRC
jgi:small GTP-binding protein